MNMKGNETARQRRRRRGVTGIMVLMIPLILAAGAAGQENAEFELTAINGLRIGELSRQIDHSTWGGSFSAGSVPLMVGDALLVIEENGSETLMSSLAPSFGLGGGLKVRLGNIRRGSQAGRSPLPVFLNLQGRYVCGGTASYLKPGGLALEGKRLIRESQRSRTDMFFLSLGLSVGGPFRNK